EVRQLCRAHAVNLLDLPANFGGQFLRAVVFLVIDDYLDVEIRPGHTFSEYRAKWLCNDGHYGGHCRALRHLRQTETQTILPWSRRRHLRDLLRDGTRSDRELPARLRLSSGSATTRAVTGG